MIDIKDISKWYGSFQVLTNCTTSIQKGEVVVVCGPSGSGKSTLIKCVNALGLTYGQTMRYVVLPQAFRNMLPVLLTQTIILFQDTSLVYAVGAYDLLKGFEVAGKNFNRPVEMYLLAAVTYFVICFSLSMLVRRLQKKIAIIR